MSSQQAEKLWQGRTDGCVDAITDALNRSIAFDQRLYPQDIQGSIAHAQMLGKQGILTPAEVQVIIDGLTNILHDLDTGKLAIDPTAEDIHMFIEAELTARVGEPGKKLHTARSRNDQVTTDFRLYINAEINKLDALLCQLQGALSAQAEAHAETLMPGYTHLQRAQPVTFAQHMMAYHAMFARDRSRLADAQTRIMQSPLGSGALAGSTFEIDRKHTAEALGFAGVMQNTLDAVSDRDYVLEFLSTASILSMHLSRLCEELIVWCSQEFDFVRLDDRYTTGSSMMPQKKNPDLAELIRGKTGRIYGNLVSMLTVMKALPLAYNKDMQEDKEAVFDTVDTLTLCLQAMTAMITSLTPNVSVMQTAAEAGFLNATDLAEYLVRKGVPFREAYHIVGKLVRQALDSQNTLEGLTLADFQNASPVFEADVFQALDLRQSLKARAQ